MKKTVLTVVFSVMLTAIVLGGIFIFWQMSQDKSLDKEVDIQKGVDEMVKDQEKEFVKSEVISETKQESLDEKNNVEDLCNAQPTPIEIGSDIYPIDEKYKNIQFLGQIFTAYDCGEDRINKIFGVNDGVYAMGSTIWLREDPTDSLIKVFKELNFSCGEEKIYENNCKKWQLEEYIKVDEIMKLEPYYESFEADDCIHCG
ncbi:MAG: hypothetical protein KAT32_00395 [Candidatus Moranbacteria bacterium]|nr:hypothetical protein [Candidatus Moranbacteria bacterium]